MHNHRAGRRLAAALVVTILFAAALVPGRALAGGNIGPRAMLIAYYDLINARDYNTAYQQWEAPTQTYTDFVNGYAYTTGVNAYFGGFQARQPYDLEGCVPGVLIGYHTDGSAAAYRGHYTVRYHPEATGMAQWTIVNGIFTRLGYIPSSEALIYRDELDINCIEQGSGIEPPPTTMLNNYIDAVNRGEFDEAYAYWRNPVQTYNDFVLGWTQTTETVLFYGTFQAYSNPAVVEAGRIPVMMLGYQTDGSRAAYQGCLGLSYNATAPERWGIYAAYLYPMPVEPVNAQAITNGLNVACY